MTVGAETPAPCVIPAKLVICPDSVDYCGAIGLAIDDWMEQRLLDVWLPGGKFQLENWDQAVSLGKRFEVKVVPVLHDSYMRDEQAKQMRTTVESYRGRAASAPVTCLDWAKARP